MTLADYDIGETVFEGRVSRVVRAASRNPPRPVLIKQLKALYPSSASAALVAREFEVTRISAGEGVIKAYEFLEDQGRVGIVLEDCGGAALSTFEERLPLSEVLTIATQVAGAMHGVHSRSVVHKDISPANILWNSETQVAKLIDFGASQVLDRQAVTAGPLAHLDGTLAYISPEQTGRMNRLVDRRSDLYSFGATLYQLLTGSAPFGQSDPLELIHSHLAKTPTPPSEVNPEIPGVLSDIVMLLLEKRAERRYQSAKGLQADLLRCQSLLTAGDTIERFELRQKDLDTRLRIPETLYGRERETELLLEEFEAAAAGKARVLLVAGYSGIGKTSLVHELYRAIPGARANFIEGAADQFNRGTPYASLVRALRAFARGLLAEEHSVLASWRERILDAVGSNATVLKDVIPEIEQIVGVQPPIAVVSPAEARNRFQLVMSMFIRALGSKEHPLVLFLDDLQWADIHSLGLITRFATDEDCRHILFIGAYRANELDDNHVLQSALSEMRADGGQVASIELDVLSDLDARALVSDTLKNASVSEEVARICHTKTHGNPFFLKRLLESLAEEGALSVDLDKGEWTCDLTMLRSRTISANVIDFISNEIRGLSADTQNAIEAAACIGSTFDLRTLAFALDETPSDALELLREALRFELIYPGQEGFWFAADHVDDGAVTFTYRFAHDRIRQAARALMEEEQAKEVHLLVGRYLLSQLDSQAPAGLIFDVVDHFNQASDLITKASKRHRLSKLNLEAGQRATASAAFEAAHDYYKRAEAALGENAWSSHYNHTLIVHIEGARVAYLSGDYDAMEALVKTAIEEASSVLDRVRAREVEINALVAAQEFLGAVNLAREVLANLGVELPKNPTDSDVEAAIVAAIGSLSSQTPESVLALGEATDESALAARRIQSGIMSAAYLAAPKLLPILACNVVRSTLDHGMSQESPYGLAVLGLVFNAINQIDLAYSTGKIALATLEELDATAVRASTTHVVNIHINAFKEPLVSTGERCNNVFKVGMQTGDLEYAAWALHNGVCQLFYAGTELGSLAETCDRNLQALQHHKQMPAIACTIAYEQALENLTGGAADLHRLVGPRYDEGTHAKELETVNFRGARHIVSVVGTFIRFLFRSLEEAVECAESGAPFADGTTATYHAVWWHQYRALALLGRMQMGDPRIEDTLADLEPTLAQLKIWNDASPGNHAHRVSLINAEIARLGDRRGEAIDLFNQSIARAREAGFLHEEAIANELAGRFHLNCENPTAARAHLLEACFVYSKWGATAKTKQLEVEFEDLLEYRANGNSNHIPKLNVQGSGPGRTPIAELDLESIFKASTLITSESRLDALLSRLLQVAIENAGATRGYIAVADEDELRVVVGQNADGDHLELSNPLAAECEGVPASILSYVLRTGETILAANAQKDRRWARDAEVLRDGGRSVLCTPVIHQASAIGVVYLENHLTEDAFSPGRARVLELLSTQAAISIENIRKTEQLRRHGDHLESLVRARTVELDRALAELQKANTILDKLSTTDPLTGLPNRRHFDQSLSKEWSRARRAKEPLWVLMIDVDCFKSYNDRYGHQQGDACLREIAQAVARTLRRATDMVARVGGEEFAAILPSCDVDAGNHIASRMAESVRALQIPHEGSTVADFVTISVGAAVCYPDEVSSPTELVAQADEQLYLAKDSGRNQVSIQSMALKH